MLKEPTSGGSGGPVDEPPDEAAPAPQTDAGPPSRARVLDAAARVFADHGLDAPMPSVAALAGVGVGTIYRAFGSKEELIAALATDRIDAFGSEAQAALAADDAWQALVGLFESTATRQAEDEVVTEALVSLSEHRSVLAAQEQASVAVRKLIERAQQQGKLRPDFSAFDLSMVFAALGAAQHTTPRGSRSWRRLLGILVDGLRAEAAHPLPEPPLTREDVARSTVERRERSHR
jgi:AcrR family transcriptional regulator